MIIPNINFRLIPKGVLLAMLVFLLFGGAYILLKTGVITQIGTLSNDLVDTAYGFTAPICLTIILVWWNSREKEMDRNAPLPRPNEWLNTNHSNPDISLVSVTDKSELAEVNEIVGKYFKKRIFWVKRVDEDCGSRNYRINPLFGRTFLLRIQKRINIEAALKALSEIHKVVHDSDVFASSPYRKHLLPKKIKGGDYVRYHNVGKDERKFISGYPFVKVTTHYSGEYEEEVVSVAEKLGGMQRVLSTIPPETVANLKSIQESLVSPFPRFSELEDVLQRAEKRRHKDDCCEEFSRIGNDLKKAWHYVQDTLTEKTEKAPCLHDFHPHNTFVEKSECVLIYDYEAVCCCWTEEAALAFSLHRFCRERIRLQYHSGPNWERDEKLKGFIADITKLFLEGYKKGRGSLPGNILANLHPLIISTNTPKLLLAMNYYLDPEKDPAGRRRETLKAEAIKFMAYIKEAKQFANIEF